jgi:hypothetical protein
VFSTPENHVKSVFPHSLHAAGISMTLTRSKITTKSTGVAVRPETEIDITSGNPVILSVL